MLLKMELKKIWKIKVLAIITAIGLLFGFLFLEFPLRYFPNGHPAIEQYHLMSDWSQKYGPELDQKEASHATAVLQTKLGMTGTDADIDELMSSAADRSEYLQQWAGALYAYELRFQELRNIVKSPAYYSSPQRDRAAYMLKHEKQQGIMPYEVPIHAAEYWKWVCVFIVLSIMILLAPVVTKDVLTDVRRLQYTSKQGRNILKTQLLAALLSAVGIMLLELLLFGVLYAGLGTGQFFGNPINSFFYGPVYWFDLTFGQYLLILLLFVVMLAFSAAGAAFFFSCFSRNYISLMLKIIPAFTLLAVLSILGTTRFLSFDNLMSTLTGIKGIELYAPAAALLTGIALCLAALKCKAVISDKDAAA